MKFPYTKYPGPKIGDLHPSRETYRPIIEVVTVYETKSLCFNALLDTGADFNLFPLEIAEALGINLSGRPALYTAGICGKLRTFFAPLRIKISEGRHVHKIDTFASFADAPAALLGQNGFFDKIKSCRFSHPTEFEISFHK